MTLLAHSPKFELNALLCLGLIRRSPAQLPHHIELVEARCTTAIEHFKTAAACLQGLDHPSNAARTVAHMNVNAPCPKLPQTRIYAARE